MFPFLLLCFLQCCLFLFASQWHSWSANCCKSVYANLLQSIVIDFLQLQFTILGIKTLAIVYNRTSLQSLSVHSLFNTCILAGSYVQRVIGALYPEQVTSPSSRILLDSSRIPSYVDNMTKEFDYLILMETRTCRFKAVTYSLTQMFTFES